jgi:RNA polymerase sigma-70 factor (ECF subfamily)
MRTDARTITGSRPDLDPAVIARASRGDPAAFTELYEHCKPGVRRYVRTIVWNDWDAEDVTQEVFVKLLVRLPQYDAACATFSAWLLRVARNTAIDHLRRRGAQPIQGAIDDLAVVDDAGIRCAESLRGALTALPHAQRQVLLLRALGGYTPPELARGGMRSRGAINALYHRARLAARDSLSAMRAGPCAYPLPQPKRPAKRPARTPVLHHAA